MSLTLSAVLAATGTEHSNPLIPEQNELVWGTISFLVFLAIMSKLVFPRVNASLAERSKNIEGKLDKAEQDRLKAQELLRQYEQKLDEATAESQRIIEHARTNAQRLEAELRQQAEQQAQRIVERAQETIRAERDRALAGLRAEVGSLAVDLASRVVSDSLDYDRQLRLVDQYINELQSSQPSGAH